VQLGSRKELKGAPMGSSDGEHARAGRPGVAKSLAQLRFAAFVLPLLVAAVLSAAAVAAVVVLTHRANASHQAQLTLALDRAHLNQLQGVPWLLADAHAPPADVLRAELARDERSLRSSLVDLNRTDPTPGAETALQGLGPNFAVNNQILEMIIRGQIADTGPQGAREGATQQAVLGAMNRAAGAYEEEVDVATGELIYLPSAVIVVLLVAFGYFYTRSQTRRWAAESLAAHLRESEAHLEHAQQLAQLGSWEWDSASGSLSCSAEHARLHGWPGLEPPDTAEGLLAVIAPEDRERVSSAMDDAIAQGPGAETSVDYRLTDSAGGRILHLACGVAAGPDGSAVKLVGTSQDITQRFRLEEAERANRAKNEFISRMSHELRTPLNAILGFGQLLELSELNDQQRGNVSHVLTAGRHLLNLINEILDLSGIESGKLRLSPEPVLVTGAVDDAVALIKPIADPRGIEVTSVFEGDDLWAKADIQRLKQVLLNLLSNAVKYNRDGGHVRVECSRSADGEIQLVVADDGPGIDPEMLERLFMPFDRLGAEVSEIEGTGLGLALSKRMVEAMGGTISIETARNTGTALTIRLAVAEPPQLHVPDETAAAPVPARDHAGKKVVCIEDNPSNLLLVEQVAAMRENLTLLSATRGAEGLDLVREHTPDLVLLDLNLPDLPGGQLLARLRSDPATAQIPVAIISADSTTRQREQMRAAGAIAYLAKPISVQELLALIDSYLGEPMEAVAS
jgi:signal transduction histidine kinase/ActR/RegA family two-component response regulator